VVTHQLQVEHRTGKVRRSKTDVLPTVPRTTIAMHIHGTRKMPVLCTVYKPPLFYSQASCTPSHSAGLRPTAVCGSAAYTSGVPTSCSFHMRCGLVIQSVSMGSIRFSECSSLGLSFQLMYRSLRYVLSVKNA